MHKSGNAAGKTNNKMAYDPIDMQVHRKHNANSL